MYGVVLWADPMKGKAVVWCEDQGDLAYYSDLPGSLHSGAGLAAGDLICFEEIMDADARRVTRPVLVERGHSPDLAQRLKTEAQDRRAPRKLCKHPSLAAVASNAA